MPHGLPLPFRKNVNKKKKARNRQQQLLTIPSDEMRQT